MLEMIKLFARKVRAVCAFAVLMMVPLFAALPLTASAGSLPSGYVQLEYVDTGTGGGPYFDTGVSSQYGLKTDIKLSLNQITSYQFLFGSINTKSGDKRCDGIYFQAGVPCLSGGCGMTGGGGAITAGTVYTFETYNGDSGQHVNAYIKKNNVDIGNKGDSGSGSSVESSYTMYLGRRNENGSPKTGEFFCGHIYYLKVYTGATASTQGTLVRDYVAVSNTTTHAVGMYDLCQGTFKPSANGTPFIGGPVIDVPAPKSVKFAVMSDLHFASSGSNGDPDVNTFKSAINYFKNQGVDAIVFNGDLGNDDTSKATKIATVINNVYGSAAKPKLLYIRGNHDSASASTDYNSAFGMNSGVTITDNKYWNAEINGYKFIGVHYGNEDNTANALNAAGLSANYDRPFFLFEHPTLGNTLFKTAPEGDVYASYEWGQPFPTTGKPFTARNAIANSGYAAKCFVTTGHDHYALTDERGIYQGSFTAVDAGSFWASIARWDNPPYYYIGLNRITTYPCGYSDTMGPDRGRANSGNTHVTKSALLYTVDADEVSIARLDFGNCTGSATAQPTKVASDWVVALNADGTANLNRYRLDTPRANRVGPQFESGAAITLDGNKIKYPQAKAVTSNGELCRVFGYKVEVSKGSSTLKTHYVLDSQYSNALDAWPAEEQYITVSSSDIGGNALSECDISVTPLDSLGNAGTPILKSAPQGEETFKVGDDVVVKFLSTGAHTWKVPDGVSSVRVLAIGGGAGGGYGWGGGGGAGEFVDRSGVSVTPGSTISITVGAGGQGGENTADKYKGGQGGNSIFGSITVNGGGGGGAGKTNYDGAGLSGGSGGGGAGYRTDGYDNYNGGSASKNESDGRGFAGYTVTAAGVSGGGGGGAGGAATSKNGGNGYASDITGNSVTYAGGGGGGYGAGQGGTGGGGAGGASSGNVAGSAATANTGSGGGGGGAGGNGGAGGSGIVIVRYTPVSVVAAPTAKSGLKYNGNAQTGVTASDLGTAYTLKSGSISEVNVGNYTAVFEINSGYMWDANGDVADKTVNWSIAKATDSWSTAPSISKSSWMAGGSAGTLTWGKTALGGDATATYTKDGVSKGTFTKGSALPTGTGTYVFTFTGKSNANYNAPSQKTITFTISAEPVPGELYPLPASYRQLDYIEADGRQYFDTGVMISRNIGTRIDFMPTQIKNWDEGKEGVDNTGFNVYLGVQVCKTADQINYNKPYLCDLIAYFHSGSDSYSWDAAVGRPLHATGVTVTENQRYLLETYLDSNVGDTGDNSYIRPITSFTDTTSNPYSLNRDSSSPSSTSLPETITDFTGSIYLGGRSLNGGPSKKNWPADEKVHYKAFARYYAVKIYTSCSPDGNTFDGILTRSYIPALNEEGIPGMWDQVTGTFSPSTSGTHFLYGSVLDAIYIWGNNATKGWTENDTWTNNAGNVVAWSNDGENPTLFPAYRDSATAQLNGGNITADSVAFLSPGTITVEGNGSGKLSADEVLFGSGTYIFNGGATATFDFTSEGSTHLFNGDANGTIKAAGANGATVHIGSATPTRRYVIAGKNRTFIVDANQNGSITLTNVIYGTADAGSLYLNDKLTNVFHSVAGSRNTLGIAIAPNTDGSTGVFSGNGLYFSATSGGTLAFKDALFDAASNVAITNDNAFVNVAGDMALADVPADRGTQSALSNHRIILKGDAPSVTIGGEFRFGRANSEANAYLDLVPTVNWSEDDVRITAGSLDMGKGLNVNVDLAAFSSISETTRFPLISADSISGEETFTVNATNPGTGYTVEIQKEGNVIYLALVKEPGRLSTFTLDNDSTVYTGTSLESAIKNIGKSLTCISDEGEVAVDISKINFTYTRGGEACNDWKNAGQIVITATPKDSTYSGSITATFTILKAMLTATAKSSTIVYGGTPTREVIVEGFVNNETASTARGYIAPTAEIDNYSGAVGSYSISVNGGSASNYDFNRVNGTLTVNDLGVVTVPTEKTPQVYTGSDLRSAGILNASLEDTDSATYVWSATSGSLTGGKAINVGTYTVTVTPKAGCRWADKKASDEDKANTRTFSFTIEAKPITVTAENKTRSYGDANPTFTAKVDGLVGSDTVSYTLTCTANETSNVGTYDITATGTASQGNYSITFQKGTLTINKAPLTATADDKNIYCGQTPTYTVSYTGWKNGEVSPTTAPVLTSTYTTSSPADTYPITFSTAPVFANYSVTTVPGTLTVTGKQMSSLTIMLSKETATYGADGYTTLPTITVKDGDTTLTEGTHYTVTWSPTAVTDAATYTATIAGKDGSGYLGSVTKEYTVTPATVNIPTAKTGLVYNGTEQTGVNEGTGYTLADHKKTNADNYTATATLVSTTNYKWSDDTTDPQTIDWSIAPKRLMDAMVTVTDTTATYDGQNHKPTVTVADSDASITANDYTITNEGGTNVGKYDVVVVGKGNYTGTVTLSQCFEIKYGTYSITVAGGEGGTAGSAPDYTTAGESQPVTITLPTKTGYHVASWSVTGYMGDEPTVSGTTLTIPANTFGNLTLTPTWEGDTYMVTYKANGGVGNDVVETRTYGKGWKIPDSSFTRTGYTFQYWNRKADGSHSTHYQKGRAINNALDGYDKGNVDLYAIWAANTYTVQFEGNGATSGSMENQTLTYDAEAALTTLGFTKTNYRFKGWSATGATGKFIYADAKVVSNLTTTAGATVTLHAIWEKIPLAFKFDPNGGKTLTDNARVIPQGDKMTHNANIYPSANMGYFGSLSSTVTLNNETGFFTVNQTKSSYVTYPGFPTKPMDFIFGGLNYRVVLALRNVDYTHFMASRFKIETNAKNGDYDASYESQFTEPNLNITNLNVAAESVASTNCFINVTGRDRDESRYKTQYFMRSLYYSVKPYYPMNFNWRLTCYAGRAPEVDAYNPDNYVAPFEGFVECQLPTPTRSGYTFKGWYTAAEGGTLVDANTVADGDTLGAAGALTTLYAQWDKVIAVPTADALTYNGKEQSVSFGSAPVTIGGTTQAKNADTYTATVTPNAGYCWSDGSTGEQEVEWTIGKAPLTITLPHMSGTAKTAKVAEGADPEAVKAYIAENIVYSGFVNGESKADITPIDASGIGLGGYTADLKVDCTSRVSNASNQMCNQVSNLTISVTTTHEYENYDIKQPIASATMTVAPGTYIWNGDATGEWNDKTKWTCANSETLCRGYPDSMGATAHFTNLTTDVTVTIPRMEDRPLGHDFDVGQIFGAYGTNTAGKITFDRTLTFAGNGTLRANVQLKSAGIIRWDNSAKNNVYGTPLQYVSPLCLAYNVEGAKAGFFSCNIHVGDDRAADAKLEFFGITNNPCDTAFMARRKNGTDGSTVVSLVFNDTHYTHLVTPSSTNTVNGEANYNTCIFSSQNGYNDMFVALTNSTIKEATCEMNEVNGNILGTNGVMILKNSTLHLDLLAGPTTDTNGRLFRGTFTLDDSVFEANRGSATVTNLTLSGANSRMRNNEDTINLDGPMAITYPEGSFNDEGTLVAPIVAANVELTSLASFKINASNLVAGVEGDYPLIKATNTLTIAESIDLTKAEVLCDLDGLGLKGELCLTNDAKEIRLRLTRRFEAATEGTKDLFVPDDFFTDAPTTVSKYSSAQTLLSGTNDNGVVRWHAYVAGFDFTELDTAKMVTKPTTDATVTLDSWPTTPASDSGYGVTYSLIRSTNPSGDFTNVEGAPSFKEGSSVPIFALPLPEGDNKLYFYRIKAIYTKEE